MVATAFEERLQECFADLYQVLLSETHEGDS